MGTSAALSRTVIQAAGVFDERGAQMGGPGSHATPPPAWERDYAKVLSMVEEVHDGLAQRGFDDPEQLRTWATRLRTASDLMVQWSVAVRRQGAGPG